MVISNIARWPMGGLLCCAAMAGGAAPAWAEDITFAVIGPQEYNLPVDYKPFTAIVAYGEYNNSLRQYDDHGHEVAGPDTDLFVSTTKFVRFFTIPGLRGVGFAAEYIQPIVHSSGRGFENSGIGDPLIGGAAWIKPTANSTLGFQTFASVPAGMDAVSGHAWANYSSFFADWQGRRVALTGDAGVIFRGDRDHGSAPRIDQGISYHVNLRASYRPGGPLEPFVAFDWQKNDRSLYAHGLGIASPAGHDTALGAGTMIALSKKTSLTLRYSRSIDGRNVPITNAAYVKLALTF